MSVRPPKPPPAGTPPPPSGSTGPGYRSSSASDSDVYDHHNRIMATFSNPEQERSYMASASHILFHYYSKKAQDDKHPMGAATRTHHSNFAVPLAGGTGGGYLRRRLPAAGSSGANGKRQTNVMMFLAAPKPAADRAGGGCGAPPPEEDAAGWDPGAEASHSRYSGMTRQQLEDEYLSMVSDEYVPGSCWDGHQPRNVGGARGSVLPSVAESECSHCGRGTRTLISNDGVVVCHSCDTMELVTVDSDWPSYRDPPGYKDVTAYNYKRQNHFAEWISQMQGRECTKIPEEVYDSISAELQKQNFVNIANLTVPHMKKIMRKLGLNRYFEHAQHIITNMTGKAPVRISPDTEAKLQVMFRKVQIPFMKHSPPSRRNFLSYSYVLHKFLELLGEEELAQNFPYLKSSEKLYQQDQVFRKICEDLGWEFRRSL